MLNFEFHVFRGAEFDAKEIDKFFKSIDLGRLDESELEFTIDIAISNKRGSVNAHQGEEFCVYHSFYLEYNSIKENNKRICEALNEVVKDLRKYYRL